MWHIILDNLRSLAIPSLLVGLSVSGLAPFFPSVFKLVGIASSFLLLFIITSYFLLWTFNILTPRRFANSMFVIDDDNNIALILHPYYKRYQPPGSRLGYHEAPHFAVKRVMAEELGLKPDDYLLVSNEYKLETIGKNSIVPKPYIVKIEKGKHRLGVVEHYDYVYICLVKGIKNNLQSPLSPMWFSLSELEKLVIENVEVAPWGDVIPIYKRILSSLDKLKKYDNITLR